LAIAKSCIEANQSQADADSWMAWVEKRSEAPQSPQQMEQPQDDFGDTDIPF
tara:strand:- start:1256 stop:1411 length:156 start_codon:yes stop_codon:yes gene_type:complete